MKAIIGFGCQQPENGLVAKTAEAAPETPVRSVAEVQFLRDGRTLSYYNDLFDLKPGDFVFVSGKFAGQLGVVTAVTTKFKIHLADYEKVVAKPAFSVSGSFRPVLGMMLSEGQAAAPEAALFRSWVRPPLPDGQGDEIVCGDGYAFDLADFEADPDVSSIILSRAVNYCEDGRIRYLSLKDGVGTAFVEGTLWYEICFAYRDGQISELYCDCPYPGLCKHSAAVMLLLRALLEELPLEGSSGFVAVEQSFFWKLVSITKQPVTV